VRHAFFPINPQVSRSAFPNNVHWLLIDGLGLFFPTGCLMVTWQLRHATGWRAFAWASAVVAGLGALIVVGWVILPHDFKWRWVGLYERVAILIVLAWVEGLAVKTMRDQAGK
jgi:hypothetical protein